MSDRPTSHVTLVEVLIAAGLIVLCAIAAVWVHKHRVADRRRNSCVSNLRQIDGAKDQYALEYGGIYGDMFTWYNLSLYIKDVSNKVICPSSRGGNTNVPENCYSIYPLGSNPICRIAKPDMGHALTNR